MVMPETASGSAPLAHLAVLLHGRHIGNLLRTRDEKSGRYKLVFAYDSAWVASERGRAVSLSMPLDGGPVADDRISNFLWNLLPDNPHILDQISRMGERVSPQDVFGLLRKIGEDCAGALQFVARERISGLAHDHHVNWLSEAEIAARIRGVRTASIDPYSLANFKNGKFSLAGAQPKFALTRGHDKNQFGEATGSTPTTVIIKPPIVHLNGQVENEHFCLSLLRNLLAPLSPLTTHNLVAQSEVVDFAGEKAIVVERYDRYWSADHSVIHRRHQEDLCQALGVHPSMKYQNDGGPGAKAIIQTVLAQSTHRDLDIEVFTKALMYNFLIGGTDAHAKNYSMVFGKQGRPRLAPLYDINSLLPYADDPHKERMAMSIGGKYRFNELFPRHWEKFAKECGLNADKVLADLLQMATELPDMAVTTLEGCRNAGVYHPVLDQIVDHAVAFCRKVQDNFRTYQGLKDEAEVTATPA
jgi:serine/threonine-protein kinase HipA